MQNVSRRHLLAAGAAAALPIAAGATAAAAASPTEAARAGAAEAATARAATNAAAAAASPTGAASGGAAATAAEAGTAAEAEAAGSPATGSSAAGAPAPQATWDLRWSPDAARDGLRAFETIEDDRADSHPAGAPHIFVEGANFRFNMHTVDRDTSTDRQRQEVTGGRNPAGGAYMQWKSGETWRVTYSMYIPSSLKATTTFTHIMQTKQPGTGTSPITVTSLRRVNGVQTIEHKIFEQDILVGRTNLEPLHNKWIDVEYEIKIGNGTSGRVRWVIRSGGSTVIDVTKSGVDTFLADRVRPKWGIYRSLGDTSGSLQNCYLLLTRMRAYKQV